MSRGLMTSTQRESLSTKMKGKHHSEETKQRIREKMTGRKLSDEQKAKQGVAIAAGWARRKARLAAEKGSPPPTEAPKEDSIANDHGSPAGGTKSVRSRKKGI
jgi:hypothetical protein